MPRRRAQGDAPLTTRFAPFAGLHSVARASLCWALPLALLLLAKGGQAVVVEPNGIQVPNLVAMGGEQTLQAYFDAQGEGVDTQAEASTEPGVFSPQCDFSARLVLKGSNASAGLAWYNVPANPTEKPAKVIQLVPEGSAVGQIANASDIRMSTDYTGGFIGFALTKFGGTPVYYSEYQRNVNCTGCVMPGHWKMMLSYRSTVHQSSYYVAFEDWEGANTTEWFGNDGDFNDQVFLVTGVSCPGGGEPCDTGALGLCGAGITECSFTGMPECKPQYKATAEKCDNADNDCNGRVDDGDLCADGQVCLRGKCVGACNTGEFACLAPLVCGSDNYCIDPACKDVTCDPGYACRGGQCVGACKDVVCPLGLVCQLDRCVDPCQGVTCATGTFCQAGVCVGDCTCSGCPQGQECARTGKCVEPGCGSTTCAAAQGCRAGACVDACSGAVCPGGAACSNGVCGEPLPGETGNGGGGGMSTTGAGGLVVMLPQGGRVGSAGSPPSAGNAGTSTAGRGSSEPSGCGCRTAAGSNTGAAALIGLVASAWALRSRRTRSARRTSRG